MHGSNHLSRRPLSVSSVSPLTRAFSISSALAIGLFLVLGSFAISPETASAEIATLDLLFDLDENTATGCAVATADGVAPGIELRIRSLVDTEASSVTGSTHADCIGADTFGAETALPAAVGTPGLPTAPWAAVTGNGQSGSTLIETHLPLALAGGAERARVHVALDSPSGSDALGASPIGGPLIVALTAPAVPGLGMAALFGLVLLSATAGYLLIKRNTQLGRSAGILIMAGGGMVAIGGILTAPVSVRALLGEGTAQIWSTGDEVESDLVGDAVANLDLLNVYARLDLDANELWLRADAFFGPAVCLDWGQVDPGTGFQCSQNPTFDSGPFGLKVAMTFDDGPSLTITPAIVAILRAENIPATFFMRGDLLQNPAAKAIALDIHQDPLFRIANHTYSHPRMTNLTEAEARAQVTDTNNALREAIGDPCFYPEYFRFPFNNADCSTVEIVREGGQAIAGIDIDPIDWCYATGNGTCPEFRFPPLDDIWRDDMVAYAVHRLQIKTGGIMLMHDIHQNTLDQLPDIIAAFRAEGVTFVDIADETLFPNFNAQVNQPEAPACCDGVTSN